MSPIRVRGGKRAIAEITDKRVAKKMLEHVGFASDLPEPWPARGPPKSLASPWWLDAVVFDIRARAPSSGLNIPVRSRARCPSSAQAAHAGPVFTNTPVHSRGAEARERAGSFVAQSSRSAIVTSYPFTAVYGESAA